MRPAAALALLLGTLTSTTALAVDLSGSWVIDKPAFREQLNRLMARFVAQLPPEVTDRLRAQGVDPAEMIGADAMSEADRYSVEFLPDGTIKLNDLAPEDDAAAAEEEQAMPPGEDGADDGMALDDGEGDLEAEVEAADQAPMSGQWQLEGSVLHVQLPQGDAVRTLEGPVAGDRIELRPVADPADPEAAQFTDLMVPLVRQH